MTHADSGLSGPGAVPAAPKGVRDGRLSFWLGLACGATAPMAVLGKSGVALPALLAVVLALLECRRATVRARIAAWLCRPVFLAGGVTFALWLVAVLLSSDSVRSALAWGRSLALLLLFSVVAAALAEHARARDVAGRSLMMGALLAALFAIAGIYFRAIPDFDPVDFKAYASVTCMMAPLLLWYGARSDGVWRVLAVAACLIGLAVIWGDGITLSRSALAGLIGAGVLVVTVFALARLPFVWRCAALCGLVLGCAAAAAVVLTQLPRPGTPAAEQQIITLPLPDVHRQVIWGSALDKIPLHPWFGWGPNVMDRAVAAEKRASPPGGARFATYPPGHAWHRLDDWTHTHNWVLEMAGETGLTGLAALCVTLALGLLALARRAASADASKVGWAALGLVGAFLTSSLANFSFWSVWWLVAFMSLLALIMSTPALREGAKKMPPE